MTDGMGLKYNREFSSYIFFLLEKYLRRDHLRKVT